MTSTTLEPGFRLGKYEVVEHIATGGMGSVYKAIDRKLRRTVALKVLPANPQRPDWMLKRFLREAHHAACLSHPHIVTLYDSGHDEKQDLYYLVLEFIDGIDLFMYIQRKGQLRPEDARRILIQAAKALDHAFGQGIVHRDIKPSNILLAKGDGKVTVKLTDLGLARGPDDNDFKFKLTTEGNTVGTIDYMAPEQARDSWSADVRSDIYSLGSTGYHMLAGKAPFAEGGLGERIYKIMNVAPTDVRKFNPAVSAGFWAILVKMLAKNPEDRYATPAELLHDLKQTTPRACEEEAAATVLEDGAGRKTGVVPTPSAAEEPKPPKRRTKAQATPEQAPPPEQKPTVVPLVTLEQARAAAAFHERAVQVLAEGGGDDYARQLLGNCMKLDPVNTAYRKTLREINRKNSGGTLSRWWSSLNVLASKSKIHLAHSSGDWRGVLEHGEEVLAQHPADVDAHLQMAEAAEKLDVPYLASWLLEQAHEQLPTNTVVMRALARLHENVQQWQPALALWEKVRALEPRNYEVGRKVNDLSAKAHLAGGVYRK